MTASINHTVLMSGVDYFDDAAPINPFMDPDQAIDLERARREHQAICEALEGAGVTVESVLPPEGCQDGVYTANWALTRGRRAVLASLPNARKAEEAYARTELERRGFEVITVPDGLRFSGQGDALPCGEFLLAGSGYRTDPEAHAFLAEALGFTVITLHTAPQLDASGTPVINRHSGWPDSFFYDIDLALSVIREDLIAWCPEAFDGPSCEAIRALPMRKIEVSLQEAQEGFACNLVSTGETVVMSASAPMLKAALEAEGLTVITPQITELAKGGGYIRCTTLTLDNR